MPGEVSIQQTAFGIMKALMKGIQLVLLILCLFESLYQQEDYIPFARSLRRDLR